MKRVLFLSLLLLLFIPGILFSQRDSLRSDFLDAESWFLFEEYADAYIIYKKLLDANPGNDNLKYKIGICLLNDPYRKDQSIQYLLDASKNINPDYKENSYKEETAPPDVLYYLGEAYLVNELLDMAIKTYEEFMQIMDREVYDEELVQAQIRSCENAKRLKSMPVDIDMEILGPTVNTRYADINPVISGDGNRLAFVTEQPFFDEALFCEKVDGEWSYPMSITSMLGFDADVYPVALSYDGTEMILYYDDDYIGNLYYSKLEDGFWIPAVKMGDNISTKYWESHASFSKDGQTLYFTSNRKGTNGNLDIYTSQRQPDGSWGVPVNLGPTINSRYNEETPVITEDGKTLYFSSYGHYNMGGYDVFYSRKNEDGTWAEPINMGYPINTTDDDLFFQPVNNGTGAYYSRYTNMGVGEHDIYYLDIYSVDNPRMYMITGSLRTGNGSPDPGQIAIFIVDSNNGDTLLYSSPDRETGEFTVSLKQGIYDLHFSGPGYEELIRPLSITAGSNKRGIVLEDKIAMVPVKVEPKVFEGDESQIGLRDTLFHSVAGEAIEVPLRLEPGSTLITRIIQDSSIVSADTLLVEKRRTDIEIMTLYGNSEVQLIMIDPNEDIHKSKFTVVGAQPERPKPGRQVRRLLEQLPADVDVQELYQQMLDHSEGKLKGYLEKLDLEEEAILTPGDLVLHLEDVAGEQDFSRDQVRGALSLSVAGLENREATTRESPIDRAKSSLAEKSEGALRETILNTDPGEEGIATERELFENLYDKSGTGEFSPGDVDRLLSKTVAGEDAIKLYEHLLDNSDGALKDYLVNLDLEREGITTPGKLLSHLEEVGPQQDFNMEEVREAMLKSLDKIRGEDPMDILKRELAQHSEGELKETIQQLDTKEEGITSGREFFEHLYKRSPSAEFSSGYIDRLLYETIAGNDAKKLYELILENSGGALHDYLQNLDPEKEGITTPGELLSHLEEVAETEGFTMEQVRESMLNSLDVIRGEDPVGKLKSGLIGSSDGAVKKYLLQLDAGEEGIKTRKELFEHLYKHSSAGAFTTGDIDRLLYETVSGGDAGLLYQLLVENTTGALNAYMQDFDLKKEGISTPGELIRHLEEVAEKEGFTMEQVREAMLKSLDKSLVVATVFEELKRTAEDPLGEILERIDLRRDEIYNVENLIRMLFSELKEMGYSKAEIKEMLSALFPTHSTYISTLGKGKGWTAALIVLVGSGLLIMIILWRRRRKDNNKSIE